MGSQSIALGTVPLVVLAIDQLAKSLVLRRSPRKAVPGRPIAARLGLSPELMASLLALIVAGSVALANALPVEPLSLVGLWVALGGAASNMLDHARRGAVVDHLRFARWAFNLADVAIVLGAAWAIGCSWLPLVA